MLRTIVLVSMMMVILACGNEKPAAEKKVQEHSAHNSSGLISGDYCDSVNKGLIKDDTLKGSPHRVAMNTIMGNHIHLEYNSPGVKGRTIWGGLVAYNQVWATGAHKATTVQFSKPIKVGDKIIPAGKYALFTIPGREEWTVIINSRFDQHLADEYQPSEDLVRVIIKPVGNNFTPRLTYLITKKSDESGTIEISWEKLRIELPLQPI